MRRMSKLIGKVLVLILAVLLMVGFSPMTARAEAAQTEEEAGVAEPIQIQKLVVTQDGADAKEEPRTNAKTVMTYEPGTQIAVVEAVNADWYKVAYQGNIYYVKQSDTVEANQGYAQEELDQQFEQEKLESKILIEEIERQRSEARQTRIWVSVIGVLVVAILGVAIYSHFSAKKAENDVDGRDVEEEK